MKNPLTLIDGLWAGSEASLTQYLQIEASILERMQAGNWPNDKQDDNEDDEPRLLTVDGSIGRITISGPLTNRDSPYNELFGVVSYGEIRDAMISAASNPDIKQILLDINSGGGAANGVSDVGNLIRMIDTQVKPVTAFTDGNMLSAAYWLGCSAGSVYSTRMSLVGSIGVISTHKEYSKAFKAEGVGVTVMRSGKLKALVNSYEPLTEAAKEQWQSQLDGAYKIFVDHVAEMRGQPYNWVDENMAQGREFFGDASLAAGLVDGITTFDELASKLREASLDKSAAFTHNPRNFASGGNMPNKKAFTEQDIAALAAGAPLAAAAGTETGADAAATAAAAAAAAAELATAAATAESTAQAALAAAAAAAPASDKVSEVVSFLQAQVAEKDGYLLTANVMIKTLEAKLADQASAHASLVDIAAKSVNNMRVALGMSPLDAATMSATVLLAEHKSVTGQFQTTFKAGGVAAVDAAAAEKKEPELHPLHMARIAATRSSAR